MACHSRPWRWNARSAAPGPSVPSSLHRRHPRLRVALACRKARCERLVEGAQLLLAHLDAGGRRVLLEVADRLGARDRRNVVALMEQPGERQLCRRGPSRAGELGQTRDRRQVAIAVLALEARERDSAVAEGERRDPARQVAATEWAGRDDADAELAGRGHDLFLELAGEERPLALERRNRVHGMGSTQRLGADLG